VACGYSQVFGVDFDETYSSVIRLTSMRLLYAVSAQLGSKIHQMDVNTAFLHADIQEDIYIYNTTRWIPTTERNELLPTEKGIVWTEASSQRMVQ